MNPVIRYQIAQILEIKTTEIVEIREWVHVYWVRVAGRRPTLVSKKAVGQVWTILRGKVSASFLIQDQQALIAYTDIRGTQWERVEIQTARRRWKCLKDRGWMQAA